jgi:hypothetical protein
MPNQGRSQRIAGVKLCDSRQRNINRAKILVTTRLYDTRLCTKAGKPEFLDYINSVEKRERPSAAGNQALARQRSDIRSSASYFNARRGLLIRRQK